MVRSVRSLEEKFLDYFREQTGKAVLPVGTLLPQKQEASPGSGKFTEWLDTKRSSSVVFVSFGSEHFMTKEQMAEIAFGLELSEQSFIWVIRLAGQEIEEEEEGNVVERVLPSGFLERVKDNGMVVRGWAAQTAILSHPSIGGFLTHCGSVVGELGLGVEVGRESNGEFRREKVAEDIRRVMMGEEGEELRKRGKDMAEMKAFRPHVLMLPWLALGHVIPHIELAKRLTDRGLRVHLCSTSSILSSLKQRLQQESYSAIETIEIRLPPTPGLPSHHESTSSLPSHLMVPLKKAFHSCKPAITNILTTLNPDFIVHDFFPPWISTLAAELHIRAIHFITFNASTICFYYSFFTKGTTGDSPLRAIKLQDYESRYIDRLLRKEQAELEAMGGSPKSVETSESILIFKTARSVEGKFLDYVQELTGKEAVPVGILVPHQQQKQYLSHDSHLPPDETKFAEWLDARKGTSVIFVSFGSEYFMSREEIAEIALGLEMSEQSFIWVIRLAREGGEEEEDAVSKMERELPYGFLDRVKDKGMVVNGWAPQTTILSHPSTGGFLTHCGWGSLCEGMACGVPFVALPLSLDQPVNARLVVGELGLGVEVQRGSNGEFRRGKVAEAIRRVMVGEEREELRRRAKDMAEKIKDEDEGGVDELMTIELAKRLTDRGLRVHLCSTPSILSSVKQKLQQEGYSAIETIVFQLPPTPGLPSHHESTSSLPPHLMVPLKKAFHSCKPTITNILNTLNPDFIAHGFFPPWISTLAAELHIRAIHFITFNASTICFYYSFFTKGTTGDSPLRAIKLQDYESRYIDRLLRKEQAELEAMGESPKSVETSESILIFKTARSVEGKFLDYVQELTGKEAVPVGILVPHQQQKQYLSHDSHLPPDETKFTE
ncbi:Flavanone 7-O-glucoside 2''-O-beta-L-rhamnosyltransferase [Nymphaea thermarum]|nr:Flavanone 7-O-glucoside 2''-O-beta-L-rhamnosyltransferase [Nymphaea thermarum]